MFVPLVFSNVYLNYNTVDGLGVLSPLILFLWSFVIQIFRNRKTFEVMIST
jgi:hypothetical protein